jgi:uncharacterized RDD family membrane protein YckC
MRQDDSRKPFPADDGLMVCIECGNNVSRNDVLIFDGYSVCADCKDIFRQKLAEGAFQPSTLVYASVRRRASALLLDGALLWFIMAVSFIGVFSLAGRGGNSGDLAAGTALWYVFSFVANAGYMIFFTARFGGTPGKLALKLKVLRADGGDVGYGLAAGRFFATFISSMTLGIGYLIAVFDGEKRTLHDRICGTRVVRA